MDTFWFGFNKQALSKDLISRAILSARSHHIVSKDLVNLSKSKGRLASKGINKKVKDMFGKTEALPYKMPTTDELLPIKYKEQEKLFTKKLIEKGGPFHLGKTDKTSNKGVALKTLERTLAQGGALKNPAIMRAIKETINRRSGSNRLGNTYNVLGKKDISGIVKGDNTNVPVKHWS